jgi:hypothetical protein
LRTRSVRAAAREVLFWTLPVAAMWVIYFSPRHVLSAQTAVTYLLALGIVLLAARWPDRSLIALIVLLPFQGLLLAKLWSWGVPVAIVKHLGAWKEALALGVILAGARTFIAEGRRADTLDRLALGFAAFAALYALFQAKIVPGGAPHTTSILLLGFRETAGFVLLLLGARHAPLGPHFTERAARVVLAAGAVVAAVGVFEGIDSSAWNHFVVHTIKYPGYQVAVLNDHPLHPDDIRSYGSIGVVRIGSVLLNDLSCGWYLILPFAVGLERAVRRSTSPPVLLATLLVGVALLLTQTRSAILGALVVAFLTLQQTAGRGRHWRTQVAIVLGGLALVGVPAAFSTGVAKRVAQANTSSDQSTAGHLRGFTQGIDTIGKHPLGLGLGTGAGTGQRLGTGYAIPENNYLEVGDELGILPMLIFTALTLALILRLRRAARERSEVLVSATWAASAGLAVAAWFLQTWSDFAVAWTFWGVAGAMLGLTYYSATVASTTEAYDKPMHGLTTHGSRLQGVASSASR